MLVGTGKLATYFTLPLSIVTIPLVITCPKYSTYSVLKKHLLFLTYNSCYLSILKTARRCSKYSLIFVEKTRMSSKKDLDCLSQEALKDSIHEGLEGRVGIGEAKRYHGKLIMPFMHFESSLVDVVLMHPDLMVT